MLKLLALGASSAIAHETLKHFAADGAEFYLVGRNPEKLAAVAADLEARGAKAVHHQALDLNLLEQHNDLIHSAIAALGQLDAVLIAHGSLGDQEASQQSVPLTLQEINTNFLSSVSLLTILANYFEAQRRGVIAVISSVAGDRGRANNYVYGAAMAGKTAFLSGLRGRLAKADVHVLTIKPGRVDTPMTAPLNLKKGPTLADPATVGKNIYQAMRNEKDVIYTPWFWRYIMMIIRALPESLFKRLSLG